MESSSSSTHHKLKIIGGIAIAGMMLILAPALSVGAAQEKQQKEQSKQQKQTADSETRAKPASMTPIYKDPSLGVIDEFQIRRGPRERGFRRQGSRPFVEIVNPFAVRKRGRFYGSIYHYHRNDFFDARNFFDPVGEKLPEFKRNQFGASFGAFISPKLQVFGTYDGLRINKGSTKISLIATPEMRNGDFSALDYDIIDPFTGEAFPDNRIPASRIHPVSSRMMPTIPNPNRDDPLGNFVNNQPRVENRDTITTRVDYEFNRETKLFGNYSFTDGDEVKVASLPEFSTNEDSRNHNASITYTRAFGTSLVATFRGNFTRRVGAELSKHAFQTGLLDSLGINGINTSDDSDEGYPQMNISGYAALGQGHGNPSPRSSYWNTFGLTSNFTYVRRNHKFNFGVEVRNTQLNNYREGGDFRGKFNFSGFFTGNGFADFLLGVPSEATRGMGSDRSDLRQRTWKAYLRDDWKINPNFSLSLGLTYNFFPVTNSVHDNVSLFWPLLFEPPVEGQMVVTGSPEAEQLGLAGLRPGQAAYPDRNDWEPQVGIAYSPMGNNKLVIRASYGWDYSPLDMRRTISFIGRNHPFFWREMAASPSSPDLDMSNPFQTSIPTEQKVRAIDPHIRTGYTQEWQLRLQNEFIQSWNLEITYEGRKGANNSRTIPANVPLPGEGLIADRRPNSTIGRFDIGESGGSSVGHELEFGVRKRMTRGFSIRSDFSWNRSFNNSMYGDPSNPRDLNSEWAVAGHPSKRFSVNYIWDLPLGRNQPIAAEWAGKFRFLIEGWRLSGITSISSGRPFNPRMSGDWNNDGVSGDRPDRIASGVLPPQDRTIDRWFATEAFIEPETYGFGNSGKNILLSPGEHKWDISLIKQTRITEGGNAIEFRIQFFNAFNQTNFDRPSTTWGTDSFGIIRSARDAREIEIALKYTF